MSVDKLSQKFLRTLVENDGKANTTEIRSKTGMSRGQVNHRYKKLEDIGWIEIDREDTGKGERTPPKVAILTEEGDKAIRSGEAGQEVLQEDLEKEEEISVTKDQLKEFHKEIDGVKNKLNLVVEEVSGVDGSKTVSMEEENVSNIDEERIDRLEREVLRLRETVELLNEAVSDQNSGELDNDTTDNYFDEETIRDLKDQQQYLEEWMDVAQRHLVAMRIYLEDNDEKGMDYYLEKAAEQKNR